jgi:hypothetical protein
VVANLNLDSELERLINKMAKKQVYEDLLIGDWDNKALHALNCFVIRNLMAEDPDFCDLDKHRDKLVQFVKTLQGQRDCFRGYPWTRVVIRKFVPMRRGQKTRRPSVF